MSTIYIYFFIAALHIREPFLYFDSENNQSKILYSEYIAFQWFFSEFYSKIYQQI